MDEARFKRAQYVLFGVITLFTLIVYSMTVAPTLSYWDCGEFIACSYILGVPHPPGTPLFVVLGRVFSLLPISSDIAVRVNYMSVITEAFAAAFAFLIIVRMIRQGLGALPGMVMEKWQAVVALGCGVSGALFMAFSTTHWNNAVEAEVYGASMLLIMILVWLAMVWADRRGEPHDDRFLVAISYFALLSLGIHMTTYLAMPVIFLFIVFVDGRLRRDWRFWVSGIVLFLVAVDLMMFLIAAGLWAALSVVMAISTRGTGARWGLIAALMVAGWVGYTSQLYLPIRSAQDPWIDENNPETFQAFRGFLERKQYGQTSMVARMFDRRGTWANQFGDHPHMGFYRYWKNQYGFGGWAMLGVIALGFYGAWWLWRRSPAWASMLVLLFLVGSVGLILYMNFADGTQYQRLQPDAYMEVRHRDYFFTPGYIVFGMMMGLGFGAIAAQLAKRGANGIRMAMAVAVIAAVLPLRAMAANWTDADRSRNYTPYDYAWNLLQSCKPNAILFTSGDNDTFPLWCLQEVYKVRKDITIVNLSLVQTDWYIYQLKHMWSPKEYPPLVTFDDDQILWTVFDPSLGVRRPKEPYKDPVSGNRHFLFFTRDGDRAVSVAMMMVEHIIMNNAWRRPVYFSSNPADKSRLGLENHTRIVGQVFEVTRDDVRMEFDWPVMDSLMANVYQYRSYDDPTIGLDDNAVGLGVAFPERMFALGEYWRREGDTARWEFWLRKAQQHFPFYSRAHEQLATFYGLKGDSVTARQFIKDGLAIVSRYVEEMPDNRLYWYFKGQMAELDENLDLAEECLAKAFWINPNDNVMYGEYVSLLQRRGKAAEAARAARKYLTYYPNDQRARQVAAMRP
ncbi:MAG TPA: DUF2723 domain-containing protein [bacterium]|nr:DUF2723 domain-containing protein [bacterium]